MTEAFPDMIVGAGTVLTCEQVDRAVAAGAKFIVSPGLNPTTVSTARKSAFRSARALPTRAISRLRSLWV